MKTFRLIGMALLAVVVMGMNLVSCSSDDDEEWEISDNYVVIVNGMAFNMTIGGVYLTDANPNLTGNIKIPEEIYYEGAQYSVISIGGRAFEGCSRLTSIDIPDGVTTIGSSAFYNCSSLTSINIPNSVTKIWGGAFDGCSSLTSINIPDGVTTIEEYTFLDCSSLTSINIPDGVTTIGSSAFYNCSSLTSIDIPNSVTTIGYRAFDGCSSLTSIDIPDGVTTIWENAFQGCDNLAIIKIGTGLTGIISTNLLNHASITEVHCYATTVPNSTPFDFLYISNKAKLYIPKGTYQAYYESYWGKAFTNIIEMEE